MIRVAFTLCVLIIIASCTSNDDIDHEQTRIVSQDHDKSIIDSELSSSENSTVYEYEDSKTILRRVTDRWENPISLAKKEENYHSLLNLAKEGDIELDQQNYGTAWNRYSTASIYYPSPKVLVKAGDAQVLHILNRYETICDCDASLNNQGSRIQRSRDGVIHVFLSTYGLALDFNRYPKKNYNNEQSLNKEEEQQLIQKIECLNEKLDFEGDSADVSILKPCLD
jgi:hypothetical protein